jgi:membrane-bound lytic murein transglycosylase A
LAFSQLPGWSQEDHAAALDMFRDACGIASERAWREVCRRARALGPIGESAAQSFWEANFELQPVGGPGPREGLLTGYYEPEFPARAQRQWPFTAPVRGRRDVLAGAERAAIEAQAPRQALAWMKPEDLFFMQIQGSGVLDLPDGRRVRAIYAGSNDRPFVAIAGAMRARGLLAAGDLSGEAIRAWLAAHRGPEADALMRLDPRYIYFSLVAYDGREPRGAAGVSLTPGRALAIDPARHAYGEVYWIDARSPVLAGAFPVYRRLAMTLDVGAAIQGQVRADLYLGTGAAAGAEAGRIRHRLVLWRLVPRSGPTVP